MSVSMRFLDELDILPKNLRQSIAQFMAHVHGSVNDISKVWLGYHKTRMRHQKILKKYI